MPPVHGRSPDGLIHRLTPAQLKPVMWVKEHVARDHEAHIDLYCGKHLVIVAFTEEPVTCLTCLAES